MQFSSYASGQTDKQTNKQTDRHNHRSTSHLSRGRSNNASPCCVQVEVPECSVIPASVSTTGVVTRQQVIYTSLGRSVQLHVLHPNVVDPLTSFADPVVNPLTHVLLHYQGISPVSLVIGRIRRRKILRKRKISPITNRAHSMGP